MALDIETRVFRKLQDSYAEIAQAARGPTCRGGEQIAAGTRPLEARLNLERRAPIDLDVPVRSRLRIDEIEGVPGSAGHARDDDLARPGRVRDVLPGLSHEREQCVGVACGRGEDRVDRGPVRVHAPLVMRTAGAGRS